MLVGTLNRRLFSSQFQKIIRSAEGKVAIIQLNRPDALNSLNIDLVQEIRTALKEIESDNNYSCAILTGNDKSFAAGADIAEMRDLSFSVCHKTNFLADWKQIAEFRKPLIAAVNGYALGGGFELALMCDIIYAGDTAKFGLPEIKLGTIPGGGGTQRLIRMVGKSTAMEMTLSGRHITSNEAHRLGIVSKVFSKDVLVQEATKLAKEISSYSLPALISCKEAILKAEDLGLSAGVDFERKIFHSTFALKDRKEGMSAFLEKRQAKFTDD